MNLHILVRVGLGGAPNFPRLNLVMIRNEFKLNTSMELCLELFVTNINPFEIAVAPIKRSKSSTVWPAFLNLVFSFSYMFRQGKIGIIRCTRVSVES